MVYSIILVRYYHVEFVGFGWTLKKAIYSKTKIKHKTKGDRRKSKR